MNCVCLPGYNRINGFCSVCAPGTFYDANSQVCIPNNNVTNSGVIDAVETNNTSNNNSSSNTTTTLINTTTVTVTTETT